jgi:type IV secretory pathway VirB2 component (pilin)
MTWFKNKIKSFNVFEIGNSFVLYYALIFFSVPVLFFFGNLFALPTEVFGNYQLNYKAIFYLALGLVFFVAGYHNRRISFFAGRLPDFFKLKSEWDFKKIPWVFGIILVLGLAIKVLKIFGGTYSYYQKNPWLQDSSFFSLIGILEWVSYLALIIAFSSYFYFRKNNDARRYLWQKMAWGVFILEIAYALPSCNRTSVIVPVIIYFILKHYFSSISWRQIVAAVLGILIVFPFGNVCRNPAIFQQYFSAEEKQINAGTPVIKNFGNFSSNFANFTSNSVFSRIDQSIVFSRIIEMDEPFLYGRSFLNFFISLGPPRFIWEDKPVISEGSDFGHRSGLLAPDVKSTVGVTMVGDLYMNFGLAGVILGMFLIGIFFRFIYEYLINRTNISFSGVAFYIFFWLNTVKGMEDRIALVYAGLVKLFIILLAINYFLIKRKNENTAHSS